MRRISTQTTLIFWLLLCVGIVVLAGCRNGETGAAATSTGANPSEASEASATGAEEPSDPAVVEPQETRAAASGEAGQQSTQRQIPAAAKRASSERGATADLEPVSVFSPPQPVLVTVSAGTLLLVELEESVSSHTSQVGEKFRGFLTQDVTGEGKIALPRGTVVTGRVTEATPAKKIGGRARLSLEFDSLHLDSGQRVPLHAVFAEVGKSQVAKDAAIIGGSTIGGAILGEAIDEGEGTKIGAIVGGVAGAIAAKRTQGKPVEVAAGTVLTLELTQPVTVEVTP